MLRRVLPIALMVMLAVPARADDVVAYEADGQAPAAAADPRVAALDDAFARAVTAALGDLVDGDNRVAHKGELDKEIVGHARLWVKAFTVTRDETNDDLRHLVVSVRIDRDKLRARLAELGIPARDLMATAPLPEVPGARPVVVLERLVTPQGVRADYGKDAQPQLPGLAALSAALASGGYGVRPAPGDGDATHELAAGDIDALANQAQADAALVANVTIGTAVPARGQPVDVALVSAQLRLVDLTAPPAGGAAGRAQVPTGGHGKLAGQGSAVAPAVGEDGVQVGVDRALALAMTDVLPPAPAKLAQAAGFQGDDTPVAEPGLVLVRLPAKTAWELVLAEQHYLAGTRGVQAATLRRVSPHGYVIGVATPDSPQQVADTARHAPAAGVTPQVRIAGGIVEVSFP